MPLPSWEARCPRKATAPSTPSRSCCAGSPAATRSPGPRFFHFVTGGVTPAALGADWLATMLDQNAVQLGRLAARRAARGRASTGSSELFDLPAEWGGVLTTGATMANFTAPGRGTALVGRATRRRRRRAGLRRPAAGPGLLERLHPHERDQGARHAGPRPRHRAHLRARRASGGWTVAALEARAAGRSAARRRS